MRLFLTSFAYYTLHLLIPFLEKEPRELSVAFVPTAANLYENAPWVEADRKKLVELGFSVFDVDIEGKTEKELENDLKNADILFVAGGNTFYLLEKAQQSGFTTLAKKFVAGDKLYIGSSAGSVLAGPDIESVAIFDDPNEANLTSTTGLGFVDFVILSHYQKEDAADYEKAIKDFGKKYTFVNLTNNQAIYVEGKKHKILEA